MQLSDIKVMKKPLVRATTSQIDKLEAELWITFPVGYREFITEFGEGLLGGAFVRIYPPWRIASELEEWRDRIKKHWFWDRGKKLLPKARALECMILGDTVQGDELVFHPCKPDRLFVFPSESEQIFEAGSDLLSAIDWMCGSGKLTKKFAEREFEPFDSRKESRSTGERRTGSPVDPDGETLDELMEKARRWMGRHDVLRLLRDEVHMPAGLANFPDEQMQVTVARQGLLFDIQKDQPLIGKEYRGMNVKFVLSDKKSDVAFASFEFHFGDGSYGRVRFERDAKGWPEMVKLYGESGQ